MQIASALNLLLMKAIFMGRILFLRKEEKRRKQELKFIF